MIQITKVKKIFHDAGVQISTSAIILIRHDIDKQIRQMAERCNDGNVKRLTVSTYHIAIGKYDTYLSKDKPPNKGEQV
tara:strand:- start:181 stop:414 length:234 start_codon:yes stop_codon:yes gene_type:complete